MSLNKISDEDTMTAYPSTSMS